MILPNESPDHLPGVRKHLHAVSERLHEELFKQARWSPTKRKRVYTHAYIARLLMKARWSAAFVRTL